MKRVGELDFPRELVTLAHQVADERIKRNAGNPDAYYHRGEDNGRINYIGALGEIVVRWWCDTTGRKYTASPLLDEKPVVDCDIVINGNRIDIKTTSRPNAVYVNHRAHRNTRKVNDGVLFVLIENSLPHFAQLFYATHAEVSAWPVEKLKYTEAFCWNGDLNEVLK